jgi:hypothetical protein
VKESYNIGLLVHNFKSYENFSIVEKELSAYFRQSKIYIITTTLDGFEDPVSNLIEIKNFDTIVFDLILFSEPYVDEYNIKFLLEKPNLKKAFINYAPLWSFDHRLHFQLAFYKEMDLILCYSEYEVNNFSINGIQIEKLYLVPDLIKSHISNSAISAQNPRKYFLLWTPHWTDYWYGYPFGYGGWYLYIETLYRFAKRNSNLLFLVRPHPFFANKLDDYKQRGVINESPIGRGLIFWEQLINLNNVFMSESSLELDLLSAKYLLTDPSTPMVYADAAKIKAAIFRFRGSPPLSEIGDESLSRHFKVNRISLYFWLIYGKLGHMFNIDFSKYFRKSDFVSDRTYTKSVESYLSPIEELLRK